MLTQLKKYFKTNVDIIIISIIIYILLMITS